MPGFAPLGHSALRLSRGRGPRSGTLSLSFNLGGSAILTCHGHRMMIFGFLRQNLKTKAVTVAFSIAWLAAGVEPQAEDAKRGTSDGFRQEL